MGSVPPRQVVVLNIANYDDICKTRGLGAAQAAMSDLHSIAVACGADALQMRMRDANTILVRLDDLSRDEFLACLKAMSYQARAHFAASRASIKPYVLVGAMSENAQRAFVDDMARRLLAYARNATGEIAFLTGSDYADWLDTSAENVEFLTYEQLVSIDAFTGLLTPYRFGAIAQDLLDSPYFEGDVCSILYFDIEDFKSYNRAYGSEAGDALILVAARAIRKEFHPDVIAHIAIDRFVVLTNASRAEIERRCDRIHDTVRSLRDVFSPEIKCGICVLKEGASDARFAMDCAKIACETIKGLYDVAWHYFDDELNKYISMRRYVAHFAEQAVREGYVKVYYQPVVNTNTGELCGFEALSRWDDPQHGMLSPDEFIPTLEDAHLIHMVDTYVANEACRYLAMRKTQGMPEVHVSINLSRADFLVCDIVNVIEETCARWNVAHRLLAIEVTESTISWDAVRFQRVVDGFRQAGHEVWMDDFGSGYSSLNLLKDFNFDVIKIDMEFVRGMEDNPRSRDIITAVAKMAKQLNMRSLAEGVETQGQRDFLQSVGVDMLQGYLFGKPEPMNP